MPGGGARGARRHGSGRLGGQLRRERRRPAGAGDGDLAGDFALRDHGGRAADAGHGGPVGRRGGAVELEGADGGGSPGEAGRGGAGEQGGVAAGERVDAGAAVPRSDRDGGQGRLLHVEWHEPGDGGGERRRGVAVGIAAAAEPIDGKDSLAGQL